MHRRWTAFLILLSALSARATSCLGPITVCSSFEQSDLVFRGRVLETTLPPSTPQTVTYPDGSTSQVVSVPMSETARLQVLEVFKGPVPVNAELTVTAGQGMFKTGSEYVIFANTNARDKQIYTSVCTRTHSLRGPDDADLAWLRAYPTAPPTGSIYGTLRGTDEWHKPVPNAAVNLAGRVSRSATVGADGSYAFRDLPPGSYTVTAALPAGLVTGKPSTVTLAPRSCAEVDWFVHHDAGVSGRITDTGGSPVAHTSVWLLRPVKNRLGYQSVTFVQTDAEGRYAFGSVEPGSYWLAVHLFGADHNDPHPAVFYPAEPTLKTAKLLTVDASSKLTGEDFVAADALQPVTVHLRVLNEKGEPVVQGHIDAEDDLTPARGISSDRTGADGTADIQMFEGRTYTLVANTSGYREPACAGPVRFVAHEGLTLPPLTLSKTWNQCRSEQHAYEKPLTER